MKETEKIYYNFLNNLPNTLKHKYFFGIFIYALGIIIDIIIPLIQKNLIDISIENKYVNMTILLLFFSIIILSVLLKKMNSSCFRKLRLKVVEYYYSHAIKKIWYMPKENLTDKGVGYYSNLLISGCQNLGIVIAPQIFSFMFFAVQSLIGLYIVFSWNYFIGIFIIFLMIISVCNTFLFNNHRNKLMNVYRESTDKLTKQNDDYILNIITNRVYSNYYSSTNNLFVEQNNAKQALSKFLSSLEINRLISDSAESVGIMLSLIIALYFVIENKLSYGQLFAVISYCPVILRPFENYVTFLGDITQYGSNIKRYEDAFGNIQNIKDVPLKEQSKYYTDIVSRIEFRNVQVDYQNNMSLSFIIDKPTAIIGISGEGKTTIAKILNKDIYPQNGKIYINDNNFLDIERDFWLGGLLYIGQDVEIFSKDLEYNILVGKKLINKENIECEYIRLRKKLEQYIENNCSLIDDEYDILKSHYGIDNKIDREINDSIKEFITYTNSNIDKIVKRWFSLLYIERQKFDEVVKLLDLNKIDKREYKQNGSTISGGEKQKIGLARFLLKEDFDFFIIDEPFTSMDAILEKKCTRLLLEKISNKPGLIITHKLRIAELLAKTIIIMNNGVIEQIGSIKEIEESNKLYKKLKNSYDKKNI